MKTQNPIVGRSTGKLANTIFSKWKQNNVVRSKPLEVANPRTEAQQIQRSKFAFLLVIAQSLGMSLRAGFREVGTKMTEFNKFMSTNLNSQVIQGHSPNWQLSYPDLKLSMGSLDPTSAPTGSASAASGMIDIGYETSVNGNQSGGDKAYAVVILPDSVAFSNAVKTRVDGSIGIDAQGEFEAGDKLHVYLFFTSPDGRKVSNSEYVEVLASI